MTRTVRGTGRLQRGRAVQVDVLAQLLGRPAAEVASGAGGYRLRRGWHGQNGGSGSRIRAVGQLLAGRLPSDAPRELVIAGCWGLPRPWHGS